MRSHVDRRSFIRRVCAGTFALVVPQARSATGREAVARTLGDALATNDREAVARFILASPARATEADLRERVLALRLMAHGTSSREEMQARLGARDAGARVATKGRDACLACQDASHVLVRAASNNPAEFREYVEAVGGRSWLDAAVPTFQHRGLQSEIRRGLRAGEGRR